jgi:hypothetical protein
VKKRVSVAGSSFSWTFISGLKSLSTEDCSLVLCADCRVEAKHKRSDTRAAIRLNDLAAAVRETKGSEYCENPYHLAFKIFALNGI